MPDGSPRLEDVIRRAREIIANNHAGNGTGCRCCDLVDDGIVAALVADRDALQERAEKAEAENEWLKEQLEDADKRGISWARHAERLVAPLNLVAGTKQADAEARVAALVAERDALREEAKRANDGEIHWGRECERLAAERDALQEQLGKPLELRSYTWTSELERVTAERDSARRELGQAVDALENLSEDAATLEAEGLRLHDLEQRLGAMLLGFGGGHNHLEDIRAALVELGESKP